MLVGLLLLHCLAVSAKLAVPVVAEKLPASSASSNKTGSQPLLGKLQLVSLLPDGMKNGLASGLAATVVKTCLQPFDTIKTLQQIQKVRLNPLEAGLRVVRARGFFSLWAGLGVTVLGSAPSTAVYFGVYSATKKRVLALIQPEYRLAGVAIAAIVGNSVATFLRVPCEVGIGFVFCLYY